MDTNEKEREKNKYSRIQKAKKRGKTYFPIRSHDNSILEAFENGKWGYVWGRREKKNTVDKRREKKQ